MIDLNICIQIFVWGKLWVFKQCVPSLLAAYSINPSWQLACDMAVSKFQ